MAERDAPRRGSWYLLTGLLIGLALGLLYSWVISPVKYVDTAPAALRADFKDQYRAALASAYLATGDVGRAQSRLALLGDPDPLQALTSQAQRLMAEGDPYGSAYALAALAQAIQQPPTGIPPSATSIIAPSTQPPTVLPVTPASPTATRRPTTTPTPIASITPRPTRTFTPTAGAPFALAGQETICNPNLAEGLLQIEVRDAAGGAVAGAEIIITWNGGEEHFFTGLKPELGNGYADFVMTPGVIYTLQVAAGAPVTNLAAPICQYEGGEDYWGGLRLLFEQR